MEALEGEDLRARLRKGKLGSETALRYTTQLLSALEAAHDAGPRHGRCHERSACQWRLRSMGVGAGVRTLVAMGPTLRARGCPGTGP